MSVNISEELRFGECKFRASLSKILLSTDELNHGLPQRSNMTLEYISSCTTVKITEEINAIFEKYMELITLADRGYKICNIYKTIILDNFTNKIFDENGKIITLQIINAPTYNQFYYWYKKYRSNFYKTYQHVVKSRLNINKRSLSDRAEQGYND